MRGVRCGGDRLSVGVASIVRVCVGVGVGV